MQESGLFISWVCNIVSIYIVSTPDFSSEAPTDFKRAPNRGFVQRGGVCSQLKEIGIIHTEL